jgi:predicted aspartyl protease
MNRATLSAISAALLALAPLSVVPLAAQAAPHSAPMVERYGKPYVMVMVNGRGPYRFVIDTGTGGDALITPELATELALPTVGQANLSDPSGQGARKVPIVLVDSISLAGVEFTNVRAIQHTFLAEAGSAQGLLGFTLFRDYLLTLDFLNRRVTLGEGALAPDGNKTVFPFRMPAGTPIARINIAGQSVDAQLDSGGGGLVLPASLAAGLKYDIDPIPFAAGQSICTRFEIKMGRLATDVKLGRYTFNHPVVEVHPAFPLVNFGSPPMQMFAITFDQKNLLVRFHSDQRRFTLQAPPSPPRMTNSVNQQLPPPDLVPVG